MNMVRNTTPCVLHLVCFILCAFEADCGCVQGTAFTGTRGICGCYIGDDEFRSKLRQLAKEQQGTQHASSFENTAGDAWNLLLGEGLDGGLVPPARLRY